MNRIFGILATMAGCLAAGTMAGPVAFASLLYWPLSDINFREAVDLGVRWGAVTAVIGTITLICIHPTRIWLTVAIIIVVSCVITFVGIWWYVANSLA
jgi:hypothetical protein